ncbi:uncharacterized protein LOC8262864 [Ricinus communis]|uniref:Stress induced protein n=1 Tax=Ricinus communis TaxID=3988 RepID=B9SC33_RICCO|nr:uncharacterized protein LOC8262864 [Ricinus communis]EEF38891.1 conserved hypothetical protein [Ricinus communis]|eukprot:XP_002523552.1 uncharacterized protein LOC8262864 [Ricinus communis]
MARTQQKETFVGTPYSPIMEHEQEGLDHLDDYSTSGCNCFHFFSFRWEQNHGNEHGHLLGEQRETWVVKKLKKVKEVSEVVAGPRWKTFIRKISAYIKKMKRHKNNNNQFQYDPESYALNFDGDREEDDLLVPIFSSRFSVPPSADQQRQNGL